jgi:hypothetical protein
METLLKVLIIRPTVEMDSTILKGRLSGKIVSEPFELKYG